MAFFNDIDGVDDGYIADTATALDRDHGRTFIDLQVHGDFQGRRLFAHLYYADHGLDLVAIEHLCNRLQAGDIKFKVGRRGEQVASGAMPGADDAALLRAGAAPRAATSGSPGASR